MQNTRVDGTPHWTSEQLDEVALPIVAWWLGRTSADPLAVDTPSGRIWHRFTYDGYGEQADGGDIFPTAARQTHGRLRPLLAGTSCSPGRTRARGCGRSPTRPTTG